MSRRWSECRQAARQGQLSHADLQQLLETKVREVSALSVDRQVRNHMQFALSRKVAAQEAEYCELCLVVR